MRVETGRRRVPLLLTKFRNPSEEPLKGIISPQAPPAKDQNQAGEDTTRREGEGEEFRDPGAPVAPRGPAPCCEPVREGFQVFSPPRCPVEW